MKIVYKDFTMTPGHAKERFDLSRVKTVTVKSDKIPSGKKRPDGRKKGDVYQIEEEIGYDMHLENALHEIIAIGLSENNEVVDLKTYLVEYKKQKDEILNLLK